MDTANTKEVQEAVAELEETTAKVPQTSAMNLNKTDVIKLSDLPEGIEISTEAELDAFDKELTEADKRVKRIETDTIKWTGIIRSLTAKEFALVSGMISQATKDDATSTPIQNVVSDVDIVDRILTNIEWAKKVCMLGTIKPRFTQSRLDLWADYKDGRYALDEIASSILAQGVEPKDGLFHQVDETGEE